MSNEVKHFKGREFKPMKTIYSDINGFASDYLQIFSCVYINTVSLICEVISAVHQLILKVLFSEYYFYISEKT